MIMLAMTPSKGNKIMRKFLVTLEQKLTYQIEVEAENQDEAKFKAIPMIIMEELEKPVASKIIVTKVNEFKQKIE